jgi:hypothetical protein
MIKALAPKPWQAAVVDLLIHKHKIDREDARKICWGSRFDLTRIHDTTGSFEQAATWIANRFNGGPCVVNKREEPATRAVYIGRGSKWGNPFRIGEHGTRSEVVSKHENWLRAQHQLLRDIHELRGQNLMCFCAPLQCHGDLLLRLANGSREQLIRWWREAA